MSAIATATLLPEPAPRRHEEADLLHTTMAFLRWALPPDAVVNHAPGEGKRSKAAQVALARSGYCKGWPDIEIIWRSRAYFIELKAKHGILSAAQKETHRRLLYAGAPVMLCKTVPEVEAQLRECGMRLRGTVLAAIMKTPEDGPPALQREQCDEQDRKTPASDTGLGQDQRQHTPQVGRGASRRGRRLAPAPGAAA